jgi:predicted nucleotidyltransferase
MNMELVAKRGHQMSRVLAHEARDLMPTLKQTLQRHGVTRAGFFGSVARGEDDEHSDVDLLVEFAPGRSLLDQAALELDLIELFHREVEVITYQSLDPRIRQRALLDQVDIL